MIEFILPDTDRIGETSISLLPVRVPRELMQALEGKADHASGQNCLYVDLESLCAEVADDKFKDQPQDIKDAIQQLIGYGMKSESDLGYKSVEFKLS